MTPVWAQVGDYILSPEMCVERKSLSDLRQSFQSGRLYNQAEAMSKHYKTPILLIEFDRDRAFALHSSAELGSDINVRSCCHASAVFMRSSGPQEALTPVMSERSKLSRQRDAVLTALCLLNQHLRMSVIADRSERAFLHANVLGSELTLLALHFSRLRIMRSFPLVNIVHVLMQANVLGSKLTLLALHFPRLRIIWSRSLHASADIFRALKANQDDPDPLVAAAVGEHPSTMQCLHVILAQVICGFAGFSNMHQCNVAS